MMSRTLPPLFKHHITRRLTLQPTVTTCICRTLSSSSPASANNSSTSLSASSLFSRLTGSSSTTSTSSDSSSVPSPNNINVRPVDDKYVKQMQTMAGADSWTLNHFSNQLNELSGGWKAKIPFLSGTDQVKYMKKMQTLIQAMIDVLGGDADAKRLKEIGQKEKLMICIKCESADNKEINAIIKQFESMDIMHRVLRYRVGNNLPLPGSEEEAKGMMQDDLKKILSPKEMKQMQRARFKARKGTMKK